MLWGGTGLSWTAGTDVSVSLISLTAPDAPTGLAATANGQFQIDLSWTAPVSTGGSAITGYKIEVSPDGSSWSVLVDVSGSMAIDRNIDRAWRAVDHIVAALQPGRDELALFTFDTVLREVVPFTTEFDRFDDMTEKGTEKPYGKTSLYDAVADTATLVGQFGSIHHALLVVTDGVDTGSWRTAEEVSRVASEVSVPVHLLTVGGPLDARDGAGGTDSAALTAPRADLARWTGGSVRATSTGDDVREALAHVLEGLRYQDVVTFKPGFRRGWHPIRIRMSDNDWVVQVRNGYVAGRARLTRR